MKINRVKTEAKKLGINNWIKNKTAATPENWKTVLKVFKLIIAASKFSRYPVLNQILEYLMFLRPIDKKHTRGVVLNLNEDLTDKAQNVIMPVELMKKAVREASYIAIMNRCICRDLQKCETFPHDFGCIFIGQGARILEERKIGRKASVKEALDHIDKAAGLGLIGHSLWLEVEQYIWGIKDEELHSILEFCFCCPCCCTALKIAKLVSPATRKRFRSVGWKASVINPNAKTCKTCRICSGACPVEAACKQDGKTYFNEEFCLGCGICASKCPGKNIRLELKQDVKKDIKDYFWELDLKL